VDGGDPVSRSFCTTCGTAVGQTDRFCGACGSAAGFRIAAPALAVPLYAGAVAYQPVVYHAPDHVVPARKTNGFAVASLVLGLVWIYGLGSLLALIFGLVALSQTRSSEEREGGRGMAIAGVVLGIVGLVFLILVIVVYSARGVLLLRLFL
jgi:hypothetical protein